jgi:hypothetical protein
MALTVASFLARIPLAAHDTTAFLQQQVCIKKNSLENLATKAILEGRETALHQ